MRHSSLLLSPCALASVVSHEMSSSCSAYPELSLITAHSCVIDWTFARRAYLNQLELKSAMTLGGEPGLKQECGTGKLKRTPKGLDRKRLLVKSSSPVPAIDVIVLNNHRLSNQL